MCLKCGAQKMKVCVRGRGGGEEELCVHVSRCVCECVVARCCVRGSLSGPDGQKKSTERSDWGLEGWAEIGGGGGREAGMSKWPGGLSLPLHVMKGE